MPDPTLSSTALRYAAGDLPPADCAAFEERLESDQEARDAIAEAIRLSAAALHQAPPAPDSTFRAAIRERLAGWTPLWLRRRAYRGHPITWAALGAIAVAACTVIGLALSDSGEPAVQAEAAADPPPAFKAAVALAPPDVEPEECGQRGGDLGRPQHAGPDREVARRRAEVAAEAARGERAVRARGAGVNDDG